MAEKKRRHATVKTKLHPRNRHLLRYDFEQLTATFPGLAPFVKLNKFQEGSVDFFDPKAVKALNQALLRRYYGIDNWEIPAGYLCPPIPGRADYIHYLADLLFPSKANTASTKSLYNEKVKCLDIGVGANCIYPLIGIKEYGWSFIGSDIDQLALENAQQIVEQNGGLSNKVSLRLQEHPENLLKGILREDERVELTMCNPPFFASSAEAQAANQRKVNNLKDTTGSKPQRNFGGQSNELWSVGGEKQFVARLIQESNNYTTACYWFTCLVSKQSHLKFIKAQLEKIKPTEVKIIPMGQGNKTSRIIAWTFLTPKQRTAWDGLLSAK
jgi:23S rRNA (adenine1618-N6)-methyltransferase